VVRSKTTQTLDEQVGIINQINSLLKDLNKLNSKYKKEKQRNRQFEINKQLKSKQKELDSLKMQ
jgi:peptidoglycan hydrolase CwlO-like protein